MSFRLFILIFLFVSLPIYADSIPPNLAEWKDWVQYEQEYRNCPSLNGSSINNQKATKKTNHLCAWPGKLVLTADENGASFSQTWTILDKSKVPLPGNTLFWPQKVLVNQQKANVLENNQQPYIQLSKGEYKITGSFKWQKRPESLLIPK